MVSTDNFFLDNQRLVLNGAPRGIEFPFTSPEMNFQETADGQVTEAPKLTVDDLDTAVSIANAGISDPADKIVSFGSGDMLTVLFPFRRIASILSMYVEIDSTKAVLDQGRLSEKALNDAIEYLKSRPVAETEEDKAKLIERMPNSEYTGPYSKYVIALFNKKGPGSLGWLTDTVLRPLPTPRLVEDRPGYVPKDPADQGETDFSYILPLIKDYDPFFPLKYKTGKQSEGLDDLPLFHPGFGMDDPIISPELKPTKPLREIDVYPRQYFPLNPELSKLFKRKKPRPDR